jgi:methionine-rich copper-binding protein CopC
MKLLLAFLGVPAMFLWAHAILVDSNPAPHGVVYGPDAIVTLRFNSRIDGARSRLLVESGRVSHAVKIDPQTSPDILVGHITGLIAGEGVLRWQVLAVDGHITRGELPFNVQ